MQSKSFFYFILLSLVLIGTWGVWHISHQGNDADKSTTLKETKDDTSPAQESSLKPTESAKTADRPKQSNNIANSTGLSNFKAISQLINSGQALEASNSINEHHSSLSSDELESLKSALLALSFQSKSNNSSRSKNILLATSKAFDDLEVWKYLGDAAVADNDWNTAFDAYFRASELENNSIDLTQLLEKLLAASGHMRSEFENNGDQLSIKNLYQKLSDLHPNFQRFQYELAIANLKLGEVEHAKQALQLLIYDPDVGDVSKQALAQIEAQAKKDLDPSKIAAQQPKPNTRSNDIVVPLISVGSSFIVESSIERKPARLLLDTGASITSLSTDLISRLNLKPTGQSIRLSTANGLTTARIYQVRQLKLGSITLRDMLIAEIDLGSSRNFQGLLGTDALNQLKPRYNYLIDNQQRALIFRRQ